MALDDGNYVFFSVGPRRRPPPVDAEIWATSRLRDGSWRQAQKQFCSFESRCTATRQAVSTQQVAGQVVELQQLVIQGVPPDDSGELMHRRWDSQGGFQPINSIDVQATAAGRVGLFKDVDAAHGPGLQLHVLGCTSGGGKLWRTIRDANGTWLPFEDVQAVPGQIQIGPVRNVACTYETRPRLLHVVALTETFKLFQTTWDEATGG